MITHRAVAIVAIGSLEVIDLPTPVLGPEDVLVHVRYASLGPTDVYQLDKGYVLSANDLPRVVGFGAAGFVKAVGENVKGLQEGDRIATYNMPENKNKAAQEYAVVPSFLVAKIPDTVPLYEAASIPSSYACAMYTVFGSPTLAIPVPPSLVAPSAAPARPDIDLSAPVLVYGAGSSTGQFLLQALRIAGFRDIFAVASAHHHVSLRLLGATRCFDYHTPDVASQIRGAVSDTSHGRFALAVDAIATRRSLALLGEVLASPTDVPPARLAVLLPYKDGDGVTAADGSAMHITAPPWLDAIFAGNNVEIVPIATLGIVRDMFARKHIMPVMLPRLLERGEIRANPVRLIEEGELLERIKVGMDLLRCNKVSGEKVVVDMQA